MTREKRRRALPEDSASVDCPNWSPEVSAHRNCGEGPGGWPKERSKGGYERRFGCHVCVFAACDCQWLV